ncbi:MAG TPA: hypothetical protein VGM39_08505 [Kofleriaceae bacterium]|jgi:hypothetical protein
MNDLSPTTRALLHAARGGLGPDAATVARMRAGVATKVAGSAAVSALAVKIGLACVIATAGVTAAVHYTRWSTHVSVPVEHVARVVTSPSVAAPSLTPPAAPAASGIDLSREVALIDGASASLASGRPLAALDTLHTYAVETHGAGQLAEEAAAVEIEATCAAKLPEAATKLAAFDTRFPHSTQRARLTTACQ